MSAFRENLLYLRKQSNLSQALLAESLGIKRSTLNAWERGRARPKYETVKLIAGYFKVDPDTLLSSPIEQDAKSTPAQKVLAITVDKEGNENIEYVPVKAFAGYALGYGDPEYIRELPRFRLPMLRGGTYRAFEIEGDSMLPIASGSVVIGQYVESFRDIKIGDTYIFVTAHNGILFKRAARIDKTTIWLKSDNPLYESYSLPLSEINEVWKTKLYMSYQFPDPDNVLYRIEDSVARLRKDVQELKTGT